MGLVLDCTKSHFCEASERTSQYAVLSKRSPNYDFPPTIIASISSLSFQAPPGERGRRRGADGRGRAGGRPGGPGGQQDHRGHAGAAREEEVVVVAEDRREERPSTYTRK